MPTLQIDMFASFIEAFHIIAFGIPKMTSGFNGFILEDMLSMLNNRKCTIEASLSCTKEAIKIIHAII